MVITAFHVERSHTLTKIQLDASINVFIKGIRG